MSFDTRLLNGLNVLAAIVEAGNFVRAGEALGLTQSGVSRAMQRLEQQLGVGLLDRTPQSGDINKRRKTVLSGSHSVTGRLGSSRYRCRTICNDGLQPIAGQCRPNFFSVNSRSSSLSLSEDPSRVVTGNCGAGSAR
jgi:hypothetical protein